MSLILNTFRRALASSICAVFLSAAVSPTTSVAANNTNLPSPKEVVIVPTTKPEAIAHLEPKKVTLLNASGDDCYYTRTGNDMYCNGRYIGQYEEGGPSGPGGPAGTLPREQAGPGDYHYNGTPSGGDGTIPGNPDPNCDPSNPYQYCPPTEQP